MHRQKILDLIDRYASRYTEESDHAKEIAEFVRGYENCFSRELTVGHVTGSAWILNKDASSALLTHHRKLDIWVQLGGHADGDSDVLGVAQREAHEESGIADLEVLSPEIFDIDIHEIPARKTEAAHLHYDCRFLLQAKHDDYVVSDESHDLKWIPFERMTDYTTEESVLRMVEKTQHWKTDD